MITTKLIAFARLALVAHAILIPPTFTADEDANAFAPEVVPFHALRRSFDIDCPACPIATREGDDLIWTTGLGSSYILEFDVGPGMDTLNIDGVQLYPPSFSGLPQWFSVQQVDPNSPKGLPLRVTAYHFHFNTAETISELGNELLPMTLQVTAVEGQHIQPPAITINVLKDSQGHLMIASLQAAAYEAPTALVSSDKDQNCNKWPLYCKWKHIIGDQMDRYKKLGKGKDCHGRPTKSSHPYVEDDATDMKGRPPHRDHSGRPHHKHHGHNRHGHHPVFRFARRVFFTVVVPVLIGVFVGTLTYIIGLSLGCLIAMVVAKNRGGQYERIALEDDDVENAEGSGQKHAYAELPAYEAPPGYEDVPEEKSESA